MAYTGRRQLSRTDDIDAIRNLQATRGLPPPHRRELTEPELRALKALSHGLTIPEAATVLGYTKTGVDYQLANARRLLAAKTNAQAIAHALRQGLID